MGRKLDSGQAQSGLFSGLRVGLPAGMKLSVPYNHSPDLLDALAEVRENISFVYLPFHPEAALSARAFRGACSQTQYLKELEKVAGQCARLGIGMNLVANSPHWAVRPRAVARTLESLRDKVSRLKATFADLLAAREVRRLVPWVELGVSCLADVQSPVQALWWKEQVQATALMVSREINRRPDQLAALAATGLELGVVSFDDCIPGCQAGACHFRPFGGRPAKRATKASRPVFSAACDPGSYEARRRSPWLLAQKEILPGHLRLIARWVKDVKISGRDTPTGEVLRRIRLYLEARSLEHPNGYYREPPGAWRKIARCARDCPRCGWCQANLSWRPLEPDIKAPDAPHIRPAREFWLDLPGTGGVRLWLEPLGPSKRPLRAVGGFGIHYCAGKGVEASVVEAVVSGAAETLQSCSGKISPSTFGSILRRARFRPIL